MTVESLKFIKWWVSKADTIDIAIPATILWVIFSVILMFMYGLLGLTIMFLGFAFVLIGAAIVAIYRYIKSQWDVYKKEKAAEAQEIVDRLSGIGKYRKPR